MDTGTISNIATKYNSLFKSYSSVKKALISTTFIAASSIFYTFASYHINKYRFSKLPTIYHTIHGDINNNNGIILFFHGWPDFQFIYNPQVEYFTKQNYCCITFELPNMDINKIQNPWGYKLIDIIHSIANTLRYILNTNKSANAQTQTQRLILCGHDWGSYVAQLLYVYYKNEFRNFCKLILLDVADGSNRSKNPPKVYTYQYVNAAAFLLPRFIGTWILRRYYDNLLGFELPIMRLEKEENKTYFDSIQGYMYFYILMQKNLGQMNELKKINMKSRLNELDGLPILYIDAKKGWHYEVDYYSQRFKQWIDDRDYCKFVEFDCYHWIQDIDIGLPQKLNETTYEFIKE